VEIRRESYAGQTAQTLATALYDELLERYARWPGSGGEPPASAFEPPEGAFLVGWEGNEAVACGGVCHYEGTTGEIRRVYVAPAARSRALSREMLAALEEEARRLGYAFVRLETGVLQREAITLYTSSGFGRFSATAHMSTTSGASAREAALDGRADRRGPAARR
jgi:GNAT superfamily N-acetyltransferase